MTVTEAKATTEVSKRKRKPSEIPPSELRKRLINQGKHPMIVDGIIEARLAKARKKQSEGGIKGLRKRRAPAYSLLKVDLVILRQQIRKKLAYLKRSGTDADNPDAVTFLLICLAQVMHTQETMKRHAHLGRVAPARWQDLIGPSNHAHRHAAYAVMSGRMKDRLAQIEATLSGVGESSSTREGESK